MRIDVVHVLFSLVIIACSSCSGMVYGDDELSSCSSNRSSCEDISGETNDPHDAFTDFTLAPVSHAHSRQTDTTNYSQESTYEVRNVSSESILQSNWERILSETQITIGSLFVFYLFIWLFLEEFKSYSGA